MDKELRYNDFAGFLTRKFPFKVQKLSVNAGFTCPNRDGSKGYGGCTYCNNQTFNPEYCRTEKTVSVQLEEGKQFFARKYPQMKYLAYFQAYTNTYGELEQLKRMYEEALAVEDGKEFDPDVPDPYGSGDEAYEECYLELKDLLYRVKKKLQWN